MSDHNAPTPQPGNEDPAQHQPYSQPGPYGQQPPYGQQAPYGQQPQYSQPQYGQQQAGPHSSGATSSEPPLTADGDRLVATFDHLLNIVAPAVGPLILWLVTRRRGPLANSEGREALNFGITVAIIYVGIGVISLLSLFGGPLALLVPLLYPLLWVAVVVYAILGAVQANQGRPYRYPVTFRFVS
ncbi:DUF4870 domain-containing protein [Pseudoclavibacter sp. JSM 162008]|uniref:DUF4870 domain-containing protein n=1 Tax=Pseudoclavibacter sp. JSM 162008 TaxID=3229855 RepID=UPI0035244266